MVLSAFELTFDISDFGFPLGLCSHNKYYVNGFIVEGRRIFKIFYRFFNLALKPIYRYSIMKWLEDEMTKPSKF